MRRRAAIAATLIIGLSALSRADAYELNPNAEFARDVIPITDAVTAPKTVIDMAGGARTSIDAHLGKVAIVTLWATWCHVCDIEMPRLAKVAARYEEQPLVVLPVSVDDAPALDMIAAHLERHDLTVFPVLHDRHHALAGQIGLRGTPTTLIVDRFGQVVGAFEGQAPWEDPSLHDWLGALISAPDAETSRTYLAAR